MIEDMTDKQSKRLEILARIDELDRLKASTTDPNTIKELEKRKAELRAELEAL